jgi:hypothetical protein
MTPEPSPKELLIEGLSDAIGFIAGALGGYWAGIAFGLEVFAPGYSNSTIAGIVLISIGGGVGLQLARYWRSKRKD